jgi:molybdate transport system substrate-binding protein
MAIWLGLLLVLASAMGAHAAEIKVISTIGVNSAVSELAPQFEQQTGHKLAITFGVANVLKRQIEAGETFDLAIMTAAVTDDLIKQGRLVAATRTDVARGGIGVAIREGAPRPDIATVEALRRALHEAKSITYAKEGGSGIYFAGLLERLGIADAMRPTTKFGGGNVAELVAAGEADMAVQLITELTGGVGAQAKEPELASAFLKFLTAPAATPVFTAKGLAR